MPLRSALLNHYAFDTLKTKERLTEDHGFSGQQAKGLIEATASTEDRVATKADLKKGALDIVLANAAATVALLALFGVAP